MGNNGQIERLEAILRMDTEHYHFVSRQDRVGRRLVW